MSKTEKLRALVSYSLPDSHTDISLRSALESHRHWLRNHQDTEKRTLTEAEVLPFKHNLFLYLTDKRVPIQLHWPILLINDLDDPSEFTHELEVLYIPSVRLIEEIIQVAR